MTRQTMSSRLKYATRGLVAVMAFGVAVAPALAAGPADAGTTDPKYRKVSAPNVFYPVTGSRRVKDLKNYSSRHRGTDIVAPCGVNVYATHPGTVSVVTSTKWYNRYAVRVISNSGGLVVTSAYLSRVTVTDGQIIQAGQMIGSVGRRKASQSCRVYVAITNGTARYNPSAFLNSYVGKPAPISRLFGNTGLAVASFNVLGASHTTSGSRFASYSSRTPRAYNLFQKYALDVVGLQEFQKVQRDQFMELSNGTFGAFYFDPDGRRNDPENAIIWRNSTMEFVEGDTFDVPYFNGNIRHMPMVLLRQKSTGLTAWFMNVHNPADTNGPAQQWRNQAVAIEKQKMIDLRASGRPVFLTGDFNDRREAFCPLTAGMLSISPNSIPSATTCNYPRQTSIDWIFAAGQTRFSSFVRDTSPQSQLISDHPIVVTRAHLQN